MQDIVRLPELTQSESAYVQVQVPLWAVLRSMQQVRPRTSARRLDQAPLQRAGTRPLTIILIPGGMQGRTHPLPENLEEKMRGATPPRLPQVRRTIPPPTHSPPHPLYLVGCLVREGRLEPKISDVRPGRPPGMRISCRTRRQLLACYLER